MSAIVDIVNKTLEEWNAECEAQEKPFTYEIKYGVRTKKFYINKNDFIEQEIAELCLYHKKKELTEMDFLLYRIELNVPKIAKTKNVKEYKSQIEERNRSLVDLLHRNLVYEMLGSFCVLTKQTIITQDHAEYDIENDRLKQHESATGMTIKVNVGGPFFEAGNEFDVFMDLEGDYYAVYTQHEIGRKNNGIARIPKADCLVTNVAQKKIILL